MTLGKVIGVDCSTLVAFEKSLDTNRRAVFFKETFKFVEFQLYLEKVLLCSETLLELWGIEAHELAQSFEADAMADIFHTLLICNYIVI